MAVKSPIDVAKLTYRIGTSPIRLMPDFIIIGAQKGGTTSLYYYLAGHPNIVPALKKELRFFDLNLQKGLAWYRAQFPVWRWDCITGEASPDYLFHPHVPARIAGLLPHVKLIVLLRNPVDRAFSHYHHQVRRGRETLSFEDALACEAERIREEGERVAANGAYYSYNHEHFSYLARGRYVDYLQTWLSIFPREQMLILKSEDLYSDPAAIIKQTLQFLKLPDAGREGQKNEYKRYNKTPSAFRDQMDSALREQLMAYYESHNARLYELLGRDFHWSDQGLYYAED